MFGGNFAPAGWMFCEGQLLPISENDVLFQLIGTTYGGDGQENFALPDLRGRLPLHMGQGFAMGAADGVETVTLTTQQMPAHSHPMLASTNPGTSVNVQDNIICSSPSINLYIEGQSQDVSLSGQVVGIVGGSQPHDNRQPFLCVDFIISLFGIFPSQT
jgi:microcystin-dependent protein